MADLSERAANELRAVATAPPLREPVPSRMRWGGNWHCPADGSPTIEVDSVITCRTCDRSLPDRLVYQLIEFHHHPRMFGS